jgi:hypothetical protein
MSKHNLFIWKAEDYTRHSIASGKGKWEHLDYPHVPMESITSGKVPFGYNFNVMEARLSLAVGLQTNAKENVVVIQNHGAYAARSMQDYYYLMFAIPESRFHKEKGYYFSDYYGEDEDFSSATEDTLIFRVDVFPQEMPDPVIVEKLTREIVHEPPAVESPSEEDTTPYGMMHLVGAGVIGLIGGKVLSKKHS